MTGTQYAIAAYAVGLGLMIGYGLLLGFSGLMASRRARSGGGRP
jgi:hypothetical protein